MAEDNSLWRVYMQSPEWAARKAEYYSRHPKVCAACSATKPIHLHHMTYKRITEEIDSDLVPLCMSCHRAVHKFHKSEHGTSLMAATKRFIAMNGGTIPSPGLKRPRAPRKPREPRKPRTPRGTVPRAPIMRQRDSDETVTEKLGQMAYVQRIAKELGHVTIDRNGPKAGTYLISCSCGWDLGKAVGAKRSWRERYLHCHSAIG